MNVWHRAILGALLLCSAADAQTVEAWKYDDGVGYAPFAFSTGDTLVVVFAGKANVQLDSIRIAFKDAGTAHVGIWRSSGDVRPTPMAASLMPVSDVDVQAGQSNVIPTTEGSINWTSIDVSSLAIDAGSAFVVGVVMGADPGVPGVLTGKINTNNQPDHSYTFFSNAQPADWTFPTDTGGYVWQFLVRAYGHLTVTNVAEIGQDVPISAVVLSNYPNPFNPSTQIHFTLPARSGVRLTVHDITGREVASLKDDVLEAGVYSVRWDARDRSGNPMSSGVYLARLQVGTGVKVTKLLLVR